jgi:hypothetical protein
VSPVTRVPPGEGDPLEPVFSIRERSNAELLDVWRRTVMWLQDVAFGNTHFPQSTVDWKDAMAERYEREMTRRGMTEHLPPPRS